MTYELCWQALRWLALEQLEIQVVESGVRADGLVVGAFDGAPLRLRYRISCDPEWQTTSVRVEQLRAGGETIELLRSLAGQWTDATGTPRADLDGAIDVDVSATPFTNTLPIRRLHLEPGASRELSVVYAAIVPHFELRLARQRYTRLARDRAGERYLYESLESDFKAELLVDEHGFVIDYPGIWKRVDPAAAANLGSR